MTENHYSNNEKSVINEIDTVLSRVNKNEIEQLIQSILQAEKVFIVGVGRVKISLSAFAKRLNHLEIKTWLVGDINEPAITNQDVLIVGSGSGESIFPKNITNCAKKYNAKVAHLTSSPQSSIAKMADVVVNFQCNSKSGEGIKTIQPMTTLFEQSLFIFGDLICLELMNRKNLSFEQITSKHANLE